MKTLNCNYKMFNPTIVSGENCYVIDETGKRYIDFEAGVWCTSLGHNNREINEAIIRQLNAISHVGYRYTTKVVDEAAEMVLGVAGFEDGKCVFLNSGSEAVEFGVQVAKNIMRRPYFLCLDKYYLSAYGISATRSREQWISLDLSEYNGNVQDFLKNVPFNEIGAFVFEPGNASGTAQLPPKEVIKAIEEKVKENDGIIIVDEVTTGVGRCGKWFGFEHYDMRPDIVSCGKGIGSGYPVSVIVMTKRVADMAENSGFRYAQSHQNDPLGCVVVKEVISVIKRDSMIQRAVDMGEFFAAKLGMLKERHKSIKEVRGVGLMLAMVFHENSGLPLEKIHREIFDAGYIVGVNPGASLLRFYPPLTIEKAQIEMMIDALDVILAKQ